MITTTIRSYDTVMYHSNTGLKNIEVTRILHIFAVLVVAIFCCSDSFAQRSLGARRLVLDDNAGKTITFQTPSPLISNYTITFPPAQGAMGTTLINDGNGNLSWSTAALLGGGSPNQVTFWTSPNTLSGENDFWWDGALNRLGIGTNSPQNNLHVVGGARITGLGGGGTRLVQVNNNGDLYPSNTLPIGTTLSFSQITAGTNTGQALSVGNGSSLTPTGTGVVASNSLVGTGAGRYTGVVNIPANAPTLFIPFTSITALSAVVVDVYDPNASITGHAAATITSIAAGVGFTVTFSSDYPSATGRLTYIVTNP
jgi:hypothetical protein